MTNLRERPCVLLPLALAHELALEQQHHQLRLPELIDAIITQFDHRMVSESVRRRARGFGGVLRASPQLRLKLWLKPEAASKLYDVARRRNLQTNDAAILACVQFLDRPVSLGPRRATIVALSDWQARR